MKPDDRFLKCPKDFWANVRLISEKNGYTVRGKGQVKAPDFQEIILALENVGLGTSGVVTEDGSATALGQQLLDYFKLRADKLNEEVESNLMDAETAKKLFEKTKKKLRPTCPLPMNKQKGKKKTPAYLTGIVNMIIEANAEGYECD